MALQRDSEGRIERVPRGRDDAPWHGLYAMLPLCDVREEQHWEACLLHFPEVQGLVEAADGDGANLLWRVAQRGDGRAAHVLLKHGYSGLAARRDATYGLDAREVARAEGHAVLAKTLSAFAGGPKDRAASRSRRRAPFSWRGVAKRIGRSLGLVRAKFERDSRLTLASRGSSQL